MRLPSRTAGSPEDLSSKQKMEASSSTTGFFQQPPKLLNGTQEDAAFTRVLDLYLPHSVQHSIIKDISSMGDLAISEKVLTYVADAEKNVPYLKTWDTFGKRKDELVTSEGWRRLQEIGIQEGMVAIPYEQKSGPYSRVHQFLKYHLWSGSCASVTCPSAMSDGAASLLSRHLSRSPLEPSIRSVVESAYSRLISRDPSQAWTSGQWMTERTGGSDISRTETIAKKADMPLQCDSVDGSPLGPYSISGFKWFSSATDANMAVLLARTHSGRLSAFYAPMRRTIAGKPSEMELNGVTIQRLKSKLGTRTLPTAELVLNDMRGYMLGQEGDGVREISTLLNVTRIHNTVTAMGSWGRGLSISRAFARVRIVSGRRLTDIPAHVATMASQHVEYRGWMHLAFFAVLLLGISEQAPASSLTYLSSSASPSLSKLQPSHADAKTLLRVLTPIIKGLTAKAAIAGLAECMESLGGIGYLENEDMAFNIARLFRDANVLSIWEGTTDIMASDMLRVLKGKQGPETLQVLDAWLHRMGVQETMPLRERWRIWVSRVRGAGLHELQVVGREVMLELGRILAGVLLFVDIERDGDEVAAEIARRWTGCVTTSTDWKEKVKWDRRIVFGDEKFYHQAAGSKL